MEFKEKLVTLRRARGMTQTEMADLLGVTRQSVYKWEKGESYPEAMTLLAMRAVFGVSIDALLDPAYLIRMPEGVTPVVTYVGEDLPAATEVAVLRVEPPHIVRNEATDKGEDEANTVSVVTEEERQTSARDANREGIKKKDNPDDDDGKVTDKKKKRGFFARLFR